MGYPVKIIEGQSFQGDQKTPPKINTLNIPSSVEYICHKAFDGIPVKRIVFNGPLKFVRY
jgi:hypothetical protein